MGRSRLVWLRPKLSYPTEHPKHSNILHTEGRKTKSDGRVDNLRG